MIGCSYLYFTDTFLASYIFCEYFIPICDLSFRLPSVFLLEESFNFNEVESINLFFYGFCFLCPVPETFSYSHVAWIFQYVSPRSITALPFSFQSKKHFVFVYVFSCTWCEVGIKINLFSPQISILLQHHFWKRLLFPMYLSKYSLTFLIARSCTLVLFKPALH